MPPFGSSDKTAASVASTAIPRYLCKQPSLKMLITSQILYLGEWRVLAVGISHTPGFPSEGRQILQTGRDAQNPDPLKVWLLICQL